jgi:hypothetical protein
MSKIATKKTASFNKKGTLMVSKLINQEKHIIECASYGIITRYF